MTPGGASSFSDPSAELDSIAEQLREIGDWRGATQVKAQAANLAMQMGRSDLFEQRYEEAIALAASNGLPYLALRVRLQKANCALTMERSGAVIDAIARMAKEKDNELPRAICSACDAALATCADIDGMLAASPTDGAALLAAVDAAGHAATGFELAELSLRLANWRNERSAAPGAPDALAELREIAARTRSGIEGRRDALLGEAALLRASLKAAFGDDDSPIEILTRALSTAARLPSSLAQVYMALADAYCARAALEKANLPAAAEADLERAEKAAANAVAAVASSGFLEEKEAPAAKLNEVRALRSGGAGAPRKGFYGAMALEQAAIDALADNRPTDALALLDRVMSEGGGPHRMALGVRGAARYELGQYREAIDDFDARIAYLEGQMAADACTSSFAFGHRLDELQNLAVCKACALTRQNRFEEAWAADERGRAAGTWRVGPAPHAVVQWQEWREWLARERAAFISLALSRWGALAISAAPGDSLPTATLIDSFRYSDMAALLSRKQIGESSQAWTEILFDAVPALSARLLVPLAPLVERLATGADVLYLFPDADLFRVPSAALTLPDGRYLGDLCPLALAPSAEFVLAHGGPGREMALSCLAVGYGSTVEGRDLIDFARQAGEVAEMWTAPRTNIALLGDTARREAIEKAAASCQAVHFSCHGSTTSEVLDPLAASRLQVADGEISAREATEWNCRADLVFLNVCQGGRFRLEGRSKMGGFPGAFHAAGARTVIASATHIDPRPAGELALRFYRAWQAGGTKAQALQIAQQAVRRLYPEPRHWASHVLTGDYR